MDKFKALLDVAEKLYAPGGCPWDRQQTFFSLQPYVLEEAHEVIEAVDAGEDHKIAEELGDLLYTVIFYSKIAEEQERFSLNDILDAIREKLIRRHPHVFGDIKVAEIAEIEQNWDKIKQEEGKQKESILEGIPDTLPPLAKGQKILKRIKKKAPQCLEKRDSSEPYGELLIDLILKAEEEGVDIESAFRRALSHYRNKLNIE